MASVSLQELHKMHRSVSVNPVFWITGQCLCNVPCKHRNAQHSCFFCVRNVQLQQIQMTPEACPDLCISPLVLPMILQVFVVIDLLFHFLHFLWVSGTFSAPSSLWHTGHSLTRRLKGSQPSVSNEGIRCPVCSLYMRVNHYHHGYFYK